MNFGMNHTSGAGSIARPVDQQSRATNVIRTPPGDDDDDDDDDDDSNNNSLLSYIKHKKAYTQQLHVDPGYVIQNGSTCCLS